MPILGHKYIYGFLYLREIVFFPDIQREQTMPENEKFIPRGAIAFFVLLMLLGAAIWFGIYFLMLSRA